VIHHHKRSTCPISFALEVFGDRWTLLVIRDLVFKGKKRFSEFLGSTEGIATNVLSDRLQTLQDQGIIQSARDPEDGRRVLYRLTEMGLDLIPSLVELIRWGSRHDPETGAPEDFLRRIEKDRDGLIAELVKFHGRPAADDTAANG
jgi:DNA-binding HxlR family transcriptional regulator